MKYIYIIILITMDSFSYSQNFVRDSLSQEDIYSRSRAEFVIKSLDSIKNPMILFTNNDTSYLVLIKNKDDFDFKEYYVTLNQLGELKKILKLKKEKKLLKLLKENNYFDFKEYEKGYITKVVNLQYSAHGFTYFVVVDTKKNKYGEFRLPTFALPSPINSKLLVYLLLRISIIHPS